jgi:hypothetical protein
MTLVDRLARLRTLRGPAVTGFRNRVRTLVLVASSSRGGSSMLTELLRASPRLLHLRGEINPFLRLAGLGYPESGTGSDALRASHVDGLDAARMCVLDHELSLDAGSVCDHLDHDEPFILDTAWRFAVQWPSLDFDLDTWVGTALRVLRALRRERGWPAGSVPDPGAFLAALVAELPVSLAYYDVPGAASDGATPLGRTLIEEPPFIVPRPWLRVSSAEVSTKPLVIKTPSNAYRLGFLRALFPNARIRMIHLTRNPAATVNGLYDGWRYHGFHAHRMAAPLRIDGYAEPWWWKFDLPPGWESVSRSSLASVCAFQWWSAHRAILDSLDGIDFLPVRFEDLAGTPSSRFAALERIAGWLRVPFDGDLKRAARNGLDPVVATAPPGPGRWRARTDTIMPALGPEVLSLAARLGYDDPSTWT